MKFKEYKGLDLVATGNEVLDRWRKNHAFEKSLELREGAPEFIFFEGPPSANGMPGIHHVMARSIKDAICRYKTQSGYKVNRRAGWDTHGLPVELGVEKMLGITKEDIGTKISVEEYNDACRKEVMKYTAEWVNMTERVGYWVDMNDPYITYDNRYIETLWYLLKKIYVLKNAIRLCLNRCTEAILIYDLKTFSCQAQFFFAMHIRIRHCTGSIHASFSLGPQGLL